MLPFGPLSPSNPGRPVCPGGPSHVRNIIKCHCVRIQILYFNNFVFVLTWNSRKTNVTCKKHILSCWSQFVLKGVYLNLQELKSSFLHLSGPELQNHLKRKRLFYEWHHQYTYLWPSNQYRHAFLSWCSSFSFQRERKCICADIKAGFSHTQISAITFYYQMDVLPFTESEWSSAMTSCLMALCRAALSGWFHVDPPPPTPPPPPWPVDPR